MTTEEGITPPEERRRLAAQHLAMLARRPRRGLRQRVRLAMLRLWGRLLNRKKPKEPLAFNAATPLSILVIRPDHLGDMLFTVPTLRRLRTNYPKARITALVGPWSAPVLANCPYVDEIMTVRFPGFTRTAKRSLLSPYLLLLREAIRLRRRRFDVVFILRFDHWWGAFLAAMARIPERIGYDIAETAPFLTRPARYTRDRHEVAQNLRLVNILTGANDVRDTWWREPLEFPVTAADAAWARQFLEQRNVSGRLVVLHPGAGAPVKLWRENGWRTVAEALIARHDATVLLTGASSEQPMAERIADGLDGRAFVAAGETSLGQLAALLQAAHLVIGPDSGPLHLAVAVGTPTIHLHGPVDARTFGPWGDPARYQALASDWGCIACNRLDYPLNRLPLHGCVRDITSEQVLKAAEEIFAESAP